MVTTTKPQTIEAKAQQYVQMEIRSLNKFGLADLSLGKPVELVGTVDRTDLTWRAPAGFMGASFMIKEDRGKIRVVLDPGRFDDAEIKRVIGLEKGMKVMVRGRLLRDDASAGIVFSNLYIYAEKLTF